MHDAADFPSTALFVLDNLDELLSGFAAMDDEWFVDFFGQRDVLPKNIFLELLCIFPADSWIDTEKIQTSFPYSDDLIVLRQLLYLPEIERFMLAFVFVMERTRQMFRMITHGREHAFVLFREFNPGFGCRSRCPDGHGPDIPFLHARQNLRQSVFVCREMQVGMRIYQVRRHSKIPNSVWNTLSTQTATCEPENQMMSVGDNLRFNTR